MKNPPHPGVLVSVDCLERSGLTVTDAAKRLNVSRSAMSNLVNEKADLSWEMAVRLSKLSEERPKGGCGYSFNMMLPRSKMGQQSQSRSTSQTNGVRNSNVHRTE